MKDPPYDKKTAPGGNQGAAKTNQTRPDNTARPGDGKRVFDPATLDAMRHRLHEYLTARGVELTRRGARLVARCPMHDDSSPSFAVYGSKLENCGCHPCAFSGDVFAASQWMGRASNFPEAVRDVADTLGVYLPDSTAGTVTRPATPPQRAA